MVYCFVTEFKCLMLALTLKWLFALTTVCYLLGLAIRFVFCCAANFACYDLLFIWNCDVYLWFLFFVGLDCFDLLLLFVLLCLC